MYDEMVKQKVVVELKKLVNNVGDIKDIDAYTEFMREVILNTYSAN